MSSLTLCPRVLHLLQGSPLLLALAGCLVCTALARRCQGWKALSSRSCVCGCHPLLIFCEC